MKTKNSKSHSKRNNQLTWRERFNIYKEQYDKKAESLARYGISMSNPKYENIRTFKEMYIKERNNLKLDIKLGRRKTLGNVQQFLISKQAYGISKRQALSLIKSDAFTKEFKDDLSELTKRYGKRNLLLAIRDKQWLEEIGWYDSIREYRDVLFQMSEKEQQEFMKKYKDAKSFKDAIRMEISLTYYGSK